MAVSTNLRRTAPHDEGSPLHAAPVRLERLIGLLLACYWIAMFIGTHMPMPRLETMPPQSDKLMHFGAYAGLAFLLSLWIAARGRLTAWTPLLVWLTTAVYAVADELLQIPVYRTADVIDGAADFLGSLTGLLVFAALRAAMSRVGLLQLAAGTSRVSTGRSEP